MARKSIGMEVVAVMLLMGFVLTACSNNKIDTFNSLEEMQVALHDEFYYFEFENAVFSNAEFSAVRRKSNKSVTPSRDDGYVYFHYSMSFTICDDNKNQTYRVCVDANHFKYPTFRNNKKGVPICSVELENYSYRFKLIEAPEEFDEEEMNYLRSNFESAIENKYRIQH